MSRIVVVGDVHGCSHELDALLSTVGVGSDDALYFVGDLTTRGPDPKGVLRLVRQLGAVVVRGNHEQRLLDRRRGQRGTPTDLDRHMASFDADDWALIEATPLWCAARDDLCVVHAGVIPGKPLAEQSARTLLYLRGLSDDGRPSELRDGAPPWGERYQGPPHLVFGHNAQRRPQLHPWATGIDTGCVYGGALTALVLAADAPVPPPRERHAALVQVAARQAYFR